MMSTIDLRGRVLSTRELRQALPRAEFDVEAALETVRPICEAVRHRGAEALYELGERFDGVRPHSLRVPSEVLSAALEALDPAVRAALEESIRRARVVHADQRRTDTTTEVVPGGQVTERWVPVDRVASGEKHSRDFSKIPTGTIENIHLFFSKALNPASQARQEGERNPNPSQP
jgi:histidinol dehydrogenase